MKEENIKNFEEANCECHIDECTCEPIAENQNKKADEIDWKDQALRALAEIQNIKHRSQIEIEKQSASKTKSFAKDIISILDSYDYAFRALENLKQSEELQSTITGFKSIYNSFLEILKKHNIRKIEAQGQEFNPMYHNAIMFQKGKNNIVITEAEAGYMMGSEVLREASVIVGKE